MKKAVFFDIDGTIWDFEQNIPPSTIDAIHKMQANGHLAFLCSGRTRSFIIEEKLLQIGFDGIVAGCGTYIERGGEVLYNHELSQKMIEDAASICKKYGYTAVAEGCEHLYLERSQYEEDPFIQYLLNLMGDKILPLEEAVNPRVNKMSITFCGNDKEPGVAEFQKAGYDVIVHDDRLCEIIPAGFGKGSGIKKVCEELDIALADTLAFGDSANDIDMLQTAGCGIAMGDGTEVAKEAADYVTSALHEDGIYNGLHKMGLF